MEISFCFGLKEVLTLTSVITYKNQKSGGYKRRI